MKMAPAVRGMRMVPPGVRMRDPGLARARGIRLGADFGCQEVRSAARSASVNGPAEVCATIRVGELDTFWTPSMAG